YYVDKFLLVIGDEEVKRESQDNLDNVTAVEVAGAEVIEESEVVVPATEILVDDQVNELKEPAGEVKSESQDNFDNVTAVEVAGAEVIEESEVVVEAPEI